MLWEKTCYNTGMNTLIVPSFPMMPKEVDDHFQREADVAKSLDLNTIRVDFDALLQGELVLSGRPEEGVALYRGWMMPTKTYREFETGLAERGIVLRTDSLAYETAHTLPGWYPILAGLTPESWYGDTISQAEYPAILKDHVKSLKHLWDSACFVPDAESFPAVSEEFLRVRAEQLQGGIVLRRYFPDLTGLEVRSWWFNGDLLATTQHPDAPDAELKRIPENLIEEIADRLEAGGLKSFVSIDIAEREDSEWIVIEAGDGQVSDLPENVDTLRFYNLLLDSII